MNLRKIIWSPFLEHHLVSYGIIAYCNGKWLLVNRRHSPEFIMLMRGSYRIMDLPRILSGISKDEKQQLVNIINGTENFEYIYSQVIAKDGFESYEYADRCFANYILIITSLIERLECENTTEWLFPKGRILGREDSLQCAQREFYEETGIDIKQLPSSMVTSYMASPFVEIFQGVNNRIYETRCWLYIFHKEVSPPDIDSDDSEPGEIGKRKWVTTEEAMSLLKPSKRNILFEARKVIFSRFK